MAEWRRGEEMLYLQERVVRDPPYLQTRELWGYRRTPA